MDDQGVLPHANGNHVQGGCSKRGRIRSIKAVPTCPSTSEGALAGGSRRQPGQLQGWHSLCSRARNHPQRRRRRPCGRPFAYQRPAIAFSYLVASGTTAHATKVPQEGRDVGDEDKVRTFHRTGTPMLTCYLRINRANGRFLPQDSGYPVRVHRTVKLRIDHPEVFSSGPYVPKAGPWDKTKPVWVD